MSCVVLGQSQGLYMRVSPATILYMSVRPVVYCDRVSVGVAVRCWGPNCCAGLGHNTAGVAGVAVGRERKGL